MKFKKLFRREKQHRRAPRANEFMLESLEPRLLLSATPMMAAVVTTDHLDYAPGETAVITTSIQTGDGLQFAAGELIRFQVSRTDGIVDSAGSTANVGPAGNEAWYVVDGIGGFTARQEFDANGQAVDRDGNGVADWIAPDNDLTVNSSISTTWFVEEQYRNSSLLATASGQESGALATQAFTDARINTITTVSSSAAASIYGDTVTFTASVTPAIGHARPRGSVEFFDGTRSLGIDSTADKGNGSASIFTISLSSLTAGTHSIHAVFTESAGHGSERGESGRHHGQDHRDRHRDLDDHRHDRGEEESHRRGGQERHHHGHADHDEHGKHRQYNNSSSGNLAQTVSQKSLAGSFTVANKVYDGNVSATVQTRALTGVIGVDDVSLSSGTATFDNANAGNGKTVTLTGATLTGAAASNYDLDSVNTTTADITKANAVIAVTGYYGTYDGSAHQATGTATGVLGENLAGLNMSVTSHTNAGTYIDTVTFTDVTGNYKNTLKNVKSTINKANAVLSLTGYYGTYDGSAHHMTGTATGILGESLSGLDLSVTSHTNAGVYIDTVTFTDVTGNYKNTLKNVKSTINKANAVITLTRYDVLFDGLPHQATGMATGVLGEDLSAGLNLSSTMHMAVGTYLDTVTFTDATGNYKFTVKNVSNRIR